MFWRRKKSTFTQMREEPLFTAVRTEDDEMLRAYRHAAESIDEFLSHIARDGQHTCAAKMRFRDPGLSDQLGEDQFLFLWLTDVTFDSKRDLFVGAFFEVPAELLEWHWVGQRLEFGRDQIFDWFVNDDGCLHGGYTLRVARARLPESEREAFDGYTGVKHWVSEVRS